MAGNAPCNVLMYFIHYASFGSPQTWSQPNIDKILNFGNTLYMSVSNKQKKDYLMIEELPAEIWKWKVSYLDAVTGPLFSLSKQKVAGPFNTFETACSKLCKGAVSIRLFSWPQQIFFKLCCFKLVHIDCLMVNF